MVDNLDILESERNEALVNAVESLLSRGIRQVGSSVLDLGLGLLGGGRTTKEVVARGSDTDGTNSIEGGVGTTGRGLCGVAACLLKKWSVTMVWHNVVAR